MTDHCMGVLGTFKIEVHDIMCGADGLPCASTMSLDYYGEHFNINYRELIKTFKIATKLVQKNVVLAIKAIGKLLKFTASRKLCIHVCVHPP